MTDIKNGMYIEGVQRSSQGDPHTSKCVGKLEASSTVRADSDHEISQLLNLD